MGATKAFYTVSPLSPAGHSRILAHHTHTQALIDCCRGGQYLKRSELSFPWSLNSTDCSISGCPAQALPSTLDPCERPHMHHVERPSFSCSFLLTFDIYVSTSKMTLTL